MAKKFATVPLLGSETRKRFQVTSRAAPNPGLEIRANMDAMGRVSLESIGAHSSARDYATVDSFLAASDASTTGTDDSGGGGGHGGLGGGVFRLGAREDRDLRAVVGCDVRRRGWGGVSGFVGVVARRRLF